MIERCRNLFLLHRHRDSTPAHSVVLIDSEDDALPIERILCDDLRMIGTAWLDMPRREGEALPRWDAFDCRRFVTVLDKMCVVRAMDWQCDRIEFSLYGGHATDHIGLGKPLSLQQMRLDPLRKANYLDTRDRVGRSIDHAAPQYARKTLSWNQDPNTEYEILTLPFMPQEGFQRILCPVSARLRDI